MGKARYLAYIDEAGDDGLKIPANKAAIGSEWFVLSCVLVRRNASQAFPSLLERARYNAGMPSGRDIHFVSLNDHKRKSVCSTVSTANMRWFSIISHKENMRNYSNPRAQSVSGRKNTLYYWLSRLLIERITDYCRRDSEKHDFTCHPTDLEINISSRGGLNEGTLGTYITKLWRQQNSSGLFLCKGSIDFGVFTPSSINIKNNSDLAGLQIADVIASSLYKSLPQLSQKRPTQEFIELLKDKCARKNGSVEDYGITIFPKDWLTSLSTEKSSALLSLLSL